MAVEELLMSAAEKSFKVEPSGVRVLHSDSEFHARQGECSTSSATLLLRAPQDQSVLKNHIGDNSIEFFDAHMLSDHVQHGNHPRHGSAIVGIITMQHGGTAIKSLTRIEHFMTPTDFDKKKRRFAEEAIYIVALI